MIMTVGVKANTVINIKVDLDPAQRTDTGGGPDQDPVIEGGDQGIEIEVEVENGDEAGAKTEGAVEVDLEIKIEPEEKEV